MRVYWETHHLPSLADRPLMIKNENNDLHPSPSTLKTFLHSVLWQVLLKKHWYSLLLFVQPKIGPTCTIFATHNLSKYVFAINSFDHIYLNVSSTRRSFSFSFSPTRGRDQFLHYFIDQLGSSDLDLPIDFELPDIPPDSRVGGKQHSLIVPRELARKNCLFLSRLDTQSSARPVVLNLIGNSSWIGSKISWPKELKARAARQPNEQPQDCLFAALCCWF